VDARLKGMITPQLYLYDGVLSTPNGDRMQNFHPWEIDVSTNCIEVHKPFGASYFVVRVLDV